MSHADAPRPVSPVPLRADDIPQIVDGMLAQLSDEAGFARKHLSDAAMTLLAAMPWHGNIVELRQALARIVKCVDSDEVQLEDVLLHVRFDAAVVLQAPAGTLRAARRQFEREYIALALRHHEGRVGDAARALGIQRTNLYRKARQLGLRLRQGSGETSPEPEKAGRVRLRHGSGENGPVASRAGGHTS